MDRTQLKQAAQPDAVRAALGANSEEIGHAADPHHPTGDAVDVRTAHYKGHDIVVRTRYEITVDGQPFDIHLSVANSGRVHYHGLPSRDFGSVIDLVQKAIDVFGDEFAADGQPAGHAGHQHGQGGDH
ncbi:MAG: hypothetical protein GEU98_25100 [Pseudonocardiaceae bacterium]|nr:hypothetical protein [Pseudonocardiaceae bacterium]